MFRSVTWPEKILLGVAGILLFFGVGLVIQLVSITVLGGVAMLQWTQVSRAAQKGREGADRVQAHP
jgi:hypothetical protein